MRNTEGSALLIALLVLAIFSLLGTLMSIEAVTCLCISDNYESRMRAESASIAGLDHAHLLMRGLSSNDFLVGPDGSFGQEMAYLELAKEYEFRNPFPIGVAQMLDISNPAADLSGFPDDGQINTGRYLESDGLPLIPRTGIAMENSISGDTVKTACSRYFVKVTDNNGEESELLGDPSDSPFFDGDGEIVVRSMGIARTQTGATGSGSRKNSVAVYEGRFMRFSVFDLGPAFLVAGYGVVPSFGDNYAIDGGASPGIGVLDVSGQDPAGIIRSAVLEGGVISGAGLSHPSIADLTLSVAADRRKNSILDAGYLNEFVYRTAPGFADAYYIGNQIWSPLNGPDLGFYDAAKPPNAPEQRPVAIVVHGDLQMVGNVSGGGLLVVTGGFQCLDSCSYTGLVLVIGRGEARLDTDNGITGGLFVAGLGETDGVPQFASPVFSILGNSRITADSAAVDAALSLVPAVRIGFREIAGVDP